MGIHHRVPIRTLLGYILGVVALAWIFTTVDWDRTLRLLVEIPLPIVAGVVAASALGVVPQVWSWRVLLGHFGRPRFGDVLRTHLVVTFVNTLFPSRISGRSIAPVALRRFTGIEWTEATAVTGVHTALYALCYGLASLLGLAVLASRLRPGLVIVLTLATGAYVVVGGVILVSGWNLNRIEPMLERLAGGLYRLPAVGDRLASVALGVTGVIGDATRDFQEILRDERATAGYCLSWVLALAVLPGVRIYLLLVGFGTSPETPWLLPLYLITAYAVTVLPLTPGGIGVAEASSTLVFVALGYPAAVVVPAVVLDRFLGVYLVALAGWYPTVTADFGELLPGREPDS